MAESARTAGDWAQRYDAGGRYCELLGSAEHPAKHTQALRDRLERIPLDDLRQRAHDAELELYNFGITFTVYTQKDAIDRILPFDAIPRPIAPGEWDVRDIYHERHIIRDGIVPGDLVFTNENYRPEMEGLEVPCGTYVHIDGSDLIRDDDGTFYVLEDNARCPSGVSYMLENREVMARLFPDLFDGLPEHVDLPRVIQFVEDRQLLFGRLEPDHPVALGTRRMLQGVVEYASGVGGRQGDQDGQGPRLHRGSGGGGHSPLACRLLGVGLG